MGFFGRAELSHFPEPLFLLQTLEGQIEVSEVHAEWHSLLNFDFEDV